jgi:hypothetical protein
MKIKRKGKKGKPEIVRKVESIESRIIPVSEVVIPHSALFYGRSGTGKTTLACTYPKPLLLLDVNDKGIDSVVDVEGVDVLQCIGWEDLEQVYWFLQKGTKYKTVVLDTITQMQSFGIDKIKVEVKGDLESGMTRNMWGEVSGLMKNLILMYRELPSILVMTAQDRTESVEEGSEDIYRDELDPEVGPAVMPSIADLVNPAVKVLGQTYIKEVVIQKEGRIIRKIGWRLRLGPHPYYITKVRTPKRIKIPNNIKNPTYKKIMEILKGEYGEK